MFRSWELSKVFFIVKLVVSILNIYSYDSFLSNTHLLWSYLLQENFVVVWLCLLSKWIHGLTAWRYCYNRWSLYTFSTKAV
jgi:hypothetical protein